MTKSYSEMTTEELQVLAKEIEQDAMREYKVYAKFEKSSLLQRASATQRVNDFSLKSSKDTLISAILNSTHYVKIYQIEKILKSRKVRSQADV